MPLYEYACEACGAKTEVLQKFSDAAPESCPSCGKGPLIRLLSSPAIQFKGAGWYITDYARKGKTDAGTESKASVKGSGASETKTESATESKGESKAAASTESTSAAAPTGGDTKT